MNATKSPYGDFIKRFSLLIKKHPKLITTTLSNIFTMRLIGNKTHGDLAEIAIAEFINQYMYDFNSIHVGKDLFRAKSKEEDITINNEITGEEFPVSLKAYGDGPLQLSTDKSFSMFPYLEKIGKEIKKRDIIEKIFSSKEFLNFGDINVLPLIYDEKEKKCNILVFNVILAKKNTSIIKKISLGNGRKHPAYRFYDKNDGYICEVRYGGASANALQRGLWTNTKNALDYFTSVTNGWIDYSHNTVLVKLFSHSLVSSQSGHEKALKEIKKNITILKKENKL
ncbi:MAG: hypothetical protein DRG11_02940 [Epsilonproteobacteria bacterium]|nr:MAG: hypothetical protein DRG11_02940 [Campylobacterota bacterium]